MCSISRDNIVRMMSDNEFYDKNPAFVDVRKEMEECTTAYHESGRKAGCHCRADTKLLRPCLNTFIAILEEAKEDEERYETVNDFVRYVSKDSDISNVGVSLFFQATNDAEMQRYEYYELRKS
jgi:hypothetical protein